MILSTQTEVSGLRFGEEKTLEFIKNAGFDAADYSMFEMKSDDCILNGKKYEKYVESLKNKAKDIGLIFNQAHAPFPSYRVDDPKYNSVISYRIKRSIEIAGILGAKNIVVHPTDYLEGSAVNIEKNAEFYNSLIPTCKEYNIKIAVENMFGHDKRRDYIVPNVCSLPEEFCRMIDKLDPRYFTACLDIGHAGLVGSTAPEMIKGLGHNRLTCLHVHDNDYKEDKHMAPYFYDLDWSEIATALGEIDYTGDFTFEADILFNKFPEDVMPAAYKLLHDIGRHIISEIEAARLK